MCGITGFYNPKKDVSRSALYVSCKAMTDALTHRGPDSFGSWQDPDIPLLFGHRRLSIIDLSDEGAQPMVSASERYAVCYNGEIYNFLELRNDLEAKGVTFRGRSDTEVLLAGIEYWGLALTLQKINGLYAFALWDRKERELHFVRDRLGKKPLYVGWAGQDLVFGSEMKALRAHPSFKPEMNKAALTLFMRHGAVAAPYSIYKGVWALPAGFSLTVSLEHIDTGRDLSRMMKPYWHHLNVITEAKEKPIKDQPDEAVIDEFEALLNECVQDRMISDVPLGAFLSGGIDSSSVVALMQKHSAQPIKTFSIGFHESGFNEAEYAKKVAEHLGTEHKELYLTDKDARDVIPMLSTIYDEPFADISGIPTYLVSKFAREDVTVVLSGDGGDEMLGGYNRHVKAPTLWNAAQSGPEFMRKGLASVAQKIPTGLWDRLSAIQPQLGTRIHKASQVVAGGSEEEIYMNLTRHWSDDVVLGAPEVHSLRHDEEWLLGKVDLSFAEKMMYWDALNYLPNDILTKVDRASMAVGLEARAPLLDKRIYEYVWRLDEKYKIRGGQGKWLLREVLNRHVPKVLFERPKQGFTMPVGAWLKKDLKEWANTLLSEERLKSDGLFDVKMVRDIWAAHQKGHGNHTEKLWSILMFQEWKNTWM